jgi:hypothetical protein
VEDGGRAEDGGWEVEEVERVEVGGWNLRLEYTCLMKESGI